MPRFSNNQALPLPDATFVARFWARFLRETAPAPYGLILPCLVWQGARAKNGYGNLWFANTYVRTNRVAWAVCSEQWPPDDQQVCHRCDNPPCGEISHLFLGGQRLNMEDMNQKGRGSPPPLLQGEAHGCAKLTIDDVLAIRQARSINIAIEALAAQYNVSDSLISAIGTGAAWREAGGPITNTRRVILDLDGKVTTLKALAGKYGIPYAALKRRVVKGWSLERALTQAVKPDRRRKAVPQ